MCTHPRVRDISEWASHPGEIRLGVERDARGPALSGDPVWCVTCGAIRDAEGWHEPAPVILHVGVAPPSPHRIQTTAPTPRPEWEPPQA